MITKNIFSLSWTLLILLHVSFSSKPHHDPNYAFRHDVMVHLFEWKWNDIALECERFLGPMGYGGVQVSPPSENIIVMHADFRPEAERPWFERYQPISYELITRSGNENDFKDMVHRCNHAGVRIYVDAVINHMTGDFPKGTVGINGSTYDNDLPSYPSVPYGPEDFNENSGTCHTSSGDIENYGDVNQVRNCKLLFLHDLNHKRQHVQQMIEGYLNKLLAIGVAGFRIDAAKHMWPEDLAIIYENLNNLSTEYFEEGLQPLIYQEVIDLGSDSIESREYSNMGRVTEFKYGLKLGNVLRGGDKACYLKYFGEPWDFLPSDDAVVFIDNHDNQRGHGAGLSDILTFFDGQLYKMASVFMLAWPYGLKQVMSSYRWPRNIRNGADTNDWVGPPHDNDFNTLPVVINSNNGCDNGWECEHRYREIANMVTFSIVASYEPVVNWWDNGNQQIAFSRGDKAFLALNNDNVAMEVKVTTDLMPGFYCDIISSTFKDDICEGIAVTVHSDHSVYVALEGGQKDTMMAIHEEARIGSPQIPFCATDLTEGDFHRTVILIYKETKPGQNVFVRGGISPENRRDCNRDFNKCSLPIRHTDDGCEAEEYVAWKTNDDFLEWSGAEPQQQQYNGESASGTPLFWSTNDETNPSYNKFNQLGPNYWIMDVEMDCFKTYGLWFEFKAVLTGDNWESNVRQDYVCQGNVIRYRKPFESINHMAMCGKINIFKFESGECTINEF